MSEVNLFENFLLFIKDQNIKFKLTYNDWIGIQLRVEGYSIKKHIFEKYFKVKKNNYNFDFLSNDNFYNIILNVEQYKYDEFLIDIILSINNNFEPKDENEDFSMYKDKIHCLRNMIRTFEINYKNIDFKKFNQEKEELENKLKWINHSLRNMNLEFE